MNLVALTGRVVADPKVHTFDSGDKKTTLRIATDEGYFNKEGKWEDKAEFHNVVTNRELKYIKGDMITVTGKLKTRSYEKSGETRYITETHAWSTKFISRPKKSGEDNQAEALYPVNQASELPIDDLPF